MNSPMRLRIVYFGLSWLAAATAFASAATGLAQERALDDLDGAMRHAPISGAASIALAGLLLLMGLVAVRRRPSQRG